MNDSNSTAGGAEKAPASHGSAADADLRAFLDEVERAAERLRRLPLSEIAPETPFRPNWPEHAG